MSISDRLLYGLQKNMLRFAVRLLVNNALLEDPSFKEVYTSVADCVHKHLSAAPLNIWTPVDGRSGFYVCKLPFGYMFRVVRSTCEQFGHEHDGICTSALVEDRHFLVTTFSGRNASNAVFVDEEFFPIPLVDGNGSMPEVPYKNAKELLQGRSFASIEQIVELHQQLHPEEYEHPAY